MRTMRNFLQRCLPDWVIKFACLPTRGSRVHTPTVLQMEAVECGAAALSIVLGYHGRFVPLEQLRGSCGVSRDGTKATNLLKAARQFGLKAKGFSKQPDELPRLPLPMVVFWNFNHFVVVEGFGRQVVYLNDPATGPRKVTDDEFEAGFTGVVLVFEVSPAFQPGGSRPGLLPALRERLRGSESGLLYVVLASLMLALVGLMIPLFTRMFVDHVLVAQMTTMVRPLLIGLLIAAALQAGLTWLQRTYLLRLSTRLAVTSSYRFIRHLLRLPIEFYTQRYAGEVGSRMEINDRVAGLLSGELAANLLNVVMVVCYIGLMLYFDVGLTLVGVAIAGLNLLALQLVSRNRHDMNARMLQEGGKLVGTSMAGLQSIESLKATGGESDFFSRWAGHMARLITTSNSLQVYSLALNTVPMLLSLLATVIILGWGAARVMDGSMSVGTLVAFQSLMSAFMNPVNQLVMLGSSLQEIDGGLNRLDDVLRYPCDPAVADAKPGESVAESTENAGDSAADATARLTGQLELRNITYGYNRMDRPLVENFSLRLRPGDRVALVGPSASGKSTLAKIITGLYQPWSGEVLLDGGLRTEIARQRISNSLAMVDQDFFLYEGTAREVLTMWDSTVTEDDLIRAAKDACIHDDIAARAGGYDSRVEEGGRNFSSGQRQRLEIARALVGNPAILVLDEATSALDSVTEKAIDENLRRRGCTCVIVAHRLSTIRDCDEIVVLDHGHVVQRGTHDALFAVPGVYRKLVST